MNDAAPADDLRADYRWGSVDDHIEPLRPLFAEPGVSEVAINAPDEAWVRTDSGWERREVRGMSFDRVIRIGGAIATATGSAFNDYDSPILSAYLPTGERVQCLQAPAVAPGLAAMSVRIPPRGWSPTLEELAGRGLFDVRPEALGILSGAVIGSRTIAVAGETGVGKTTLMRALIHEIAAHERLVTIEDTPELDLSEHPNHVRLFYRSEDRDNPNALVTPASLLRACLRLDPDRILLAEIRGGESWEFVNAGLSGHAGGITSVHASSCLGALDRLALLARHDGAAQGIEFGDMRRLVGSAVDVVVHLGRISGRRQVTDILDVSTERT